MNILTFLESRLLHSISSLMKQGTVGLLYLDLGNDSYMEAKLGCDFVKRMQAAARASIQEICSTYPGNIERMSAGEDYFLYIGLGKVRADEAFRLLERTAVGFCTELMRGLRARFPEYEDMEISFGCALIQERKDHDLKEVLYTASKQAIRHAKDRTANPESAALMEEFHNILASRLVTAVYQPIVSLADGTIFGYEALTRGPEDSPLRSPVKLFELAEQADRLYAFDKMTREEAILGCMHLDRQQRIFLNIPAHILHDPAFTPGQTLALLTRMGLTPSNVVFEITERSSIEDFTTAKKVIEHYRSQGYRIAIDDAGAGYSSLQAIAEIQPDYIKVDRSLIHHIHKDKVKEYILETFLSFSKRLNIKVIAEGIEESDDLELLIRLGVHYAQGYYLGRPNAEMKGINPAALETIEASKRKSESTSLHRIGDIIVPVKTFSSKAEVSEAAEYFRLHPEQFGAVVVDGTRPVGLLMREELFRSLSVQYGISLFWNKPVTVVTDSESLTVEASTPLETVSQLAMMREHSKLYDLVIVTEHGELAGVATVRDILEHMTNIRLELARVASPLTGLPGNRQIQRELQRRIMDGGRFSVIYIDLDYFKWFNDHYGFQLGDEVIQFTADVISQAVSVCGEPLDFIGHIGGDDFIAITAAEQPDVLCEEIARRFTSGIRAFEEVLTPGESVKDRSGRPVEADSLSISIAHVIVDDPIQVSAEDISQAAASCKREAKARNGSAICRAIVPPEPSMTEASGEPREYLQS